MRKVLMAPVRAAVLLWKLFRWFINSKFRLGAVFGIVLLLVLNSAIEYTSRDSFCDICHVHPHVTQSWRQSTHYANNSGVVVHCVECHLPPKGVSYYTEKAKTGGRDIYGKLFMDIGKINWEAKSRLEHAVKLTYKASCLKCHENLFPMQLSREGEDAHLYYNQKPDELRCINCHLHVGHYSEEAEKASFALAETVDREIYTQPARVERFEDYSETVPGTTVSFDMVAIPGGRFEIGSPGSESFRQSDEGPERSVEISPFWIGRTEVSWEQFEAFYQQTATEGRTDTRINLAANVDAITGPTPPYGNPDQGWGRGDRPAITMTHHAAMTYCQWLSKVTGKKYRLPTEAEWEYACRGGSEGPYFFEGDAKDYTEKRWLNRIFGADTSVISSHVIYAGNSRGRTGEPSEVDANPFGLLNMAGNVREFCLDWYARDTYKKYPVDAVIRDPRGPDQGTEYVVRGGSYRSDAVDVRSAARDRTRHDAWMVTDPQMPKSLWWYSDCFDVGFRVICEYEGEEL